MNIIILSSLLLLLLLLIVINCQAQSRSSLKNQLGNANRALHKHKVRADNCEKNFNNHKNNANNQFIIIDDAFTIENEMLTPTMKTRRHQVKKVFGDQLEKLYF